MKQCLISLITIFPFLFSALNSNAQKDTSSNTYNLLKKIDLKHSKINRRGMITLNSWAVGNITYGSIAYFNSGGEAQYFHQMNVFWNVVNLGLGIPGLISAYKNHKDKSFESVYKRLKRSETTYLVNSALDLGYMASGWALRDMGKNKSGDKSLQMKGYGTSLIMQGGFLLLHDITQVIFHKINTKRLNPIWDKISIEPAGLGLRLKFH